MSQAYFSENAPIWDETRAEKDVRKLEEIVARMQILRGSALLDVGTGTGVLLPFLLEAVGPRGKVIGLDFAVPMLKQARTKHRAGNVAYLLADAGHVPVQSETFDAVVCYSSFPHFANKLDTLKEMWRTLKPGGRLIIGHTSCREYVNSIHARVPVLEAHVLPDEAEMRLLLISAGFTGVEVTDRPDSYLARATKSRV